MRLEYLKTTLFNKKQKYQILKQIHENNVRIVKSKIMVLEKECNEMSCLISLYEKNVDNEVKVDPITDYIYDNKSLLY